jgi:hypothetical protein
VFAVRAVVDASVATRLVVDALVAKRLDVEAFVALKLTTVPDAEVKLAMLPLEIVVVARLAVPVAVNVPATRLVVVALVAVRLVKNPVIAVKMLAKRLDDVAFVVDALVAKSVPVVVLFVATTLPAVTVTIDAFVLLRLVMVPVAEVSEEIVVVASVEVPVTESVPVAYRFVVEMFEVDALARLVLPATVSVPFETREEVNTAFVAVKNAEKNDPVDVALVNEAAVAAKRLAKRVDDVAFVVDALVAKSVVAVADPTVKLVNIPVVPLSVVIVDEGEVRSVITAREIVEVASATVPVAVSAPVVTVKNVGVEDTLIVEVPVSTTLAPAVK